MPSLILSCFILHNVAKYLNDNPDDFDELDDNENDVDDNENDDDNAHDNQVMLREQGNQRRNEISQIIFNFNQ